jgi:glucose/arabinose dehydrogenase
MKSRFVWIFAVLFLTACAAPTFEVVDSTSSVVEPTIEIPQDTDEAQAPPSEPSSQTSVLPDPNTATWNLVADGFRRPVAAVHAGDERLFIVEQAGVIWILQNGERLADPFLDITQRVNDSANEQGLLGLAFHPNFEANGHFYLNYTGTDGETRVSRFAMSQDPDRADPESEVLLLTIDQPYRNHNGGIIAFGPDNYLYIGTGDGGSAGDPQGNGQSLDTLLGKILRIDVDAAAAYAIPANNPFVSGGGLPEIWAYGLRNPWRFAFDRMTGDLYIGDVGQNQWEEINFQAAASVGGENYGWNLREGTHAYTSGNADWIDPVAEYDHSMGCSVTGGEVVRDPRLPGWSGVYLYGDYCSGRVWGLLREADGHWVQRLLYESDSTITSFGQDVDGRIYLIDHGGSLFRLDPSP